MSLKSLAGLILISASAADVNEVADMIPTYIFNSSA